MHINGNLLLYLKLSRGSRVKVDSFTTATTTATKQTAHHSEVEMQLKVE